MEEEQDIAGSIGPIPLESLELGIFWKEDALNRHVASTNPIGVSFFSEPKNGGAGKIHQSIPVTSLSLRSVRACQSFAATA